MTQQEDHRAGIPYYLKPRWIAGHLIVAGLFVLFLRLGWWQILSALHGRVISIGYALQWPAFAGFGVFLWIRTVRSHRNDHAPAKDAPQANTRAPRAIDWTFDRAAPSVQHVDPAPPPATDEDPDLRVYNDMLDWLRADPRRHPYQYRRRQSADENKLS